MYPVQCISKCSPKLVQVAINASQWMAAAISWALLFCVFGRHGGTLGPWRSFLTCFPESIHFVYEDPEPARVSGQTCFKPCGFMLGCVLPWPPAPLFQVTVPGGCRLSVTITTVSINVIGSLSGRRRRLTSPLFAPPYFASPRPYITGQSSVWPAVWWSLHWLTYILYKDFSIVCFSPVHRVSYSSRTTSAPRVSYSHTML